MQFDARKQGNPIALTNITDEGKNWIFAKIETDSLQWQDIMVNDNGEWQVNFDLYTRRIS